MQLLWINNPSSTSTCKNLFMIQEPTAKNMMMCSLTQYNFIGNRTSTINNKIMHANIINIEIHNQSACPIMSSDHISSVPSASWSGLETQWIIRLMLQSTGHLCFITVSLSLISALGLLDTCKCHMELEIYPSIAATSHSGPLHIQLLV